MVLAAVEGETDLLAFKLGFRVGFVQVVREVDLVLPFLQDYLFSFSHDFVHSVDFVQHTSLRLSQVIDTVPHFTHVFVYSLKAAFGFDNVLFQMCGLIAAQRGPSQVG